MKVNPNFKHLPTRFLLVLNDRTFQMKLDDSGLRWVGEPQVLGTVSKSVEMVNVIINREDLQYPAYISHWILSPDGEFGNQDVFYFKHLERDINHPSPLAFRPMSINRHFDSYDGYTHCNGECCPVAF